MRVVLDTNVVVSAFLSPAGMPAVILQMVLARELDICLNTSVLAEYEQVLLRAKFRGRVSSETVQRFFEIIHIIGIVVHSVPGSDIFSDEDDRVFFDLAKAANASLITGNIRHYPSEAYVYEPAAFLNHFMNGRT